MIDWTKALFPTSFKGVPFWAQRDDLEAGRRLDVVEPPGSDTPFIEDLGARRQPVGISGYVIGDPSVAQMAALIAVCSQAGAGVLVLPTDGPLTARCLTIKRTRERDRMGKITFEARFMLDPASGFATPQAAYPAAYLAQLVFDTGDQLGAALSGALAGFQV